VRLPAILSAALLLAVLLPAAPAGGAPARPTLALVGFAPLAVRGAGFAPRQKVELLVTRGGSGGVVRRSVVAGPRGGFIVRFAFAVSHCSSITVEAVGVRGQRPMVDRPTACDPDVANS
jgi:hypothetical protein